MGLFGCRGSVGRVQEEGADEVTEGGHLLGSEGHEALVLVICCGSGVCEGEEREVLGEESLSGTGELETARRVRGVPGPVRLSFVTSSRGVGFSEGVVNAVGNGIAVRDEFEFVQDRGEKDRLEGVLGFVEGGSDCAEALSKHSELVVDQV